jgi:hypothetical protein
MAKLSIAGGPSMNFDGNAARKFEAPPQPVEDQESLALRKTPAANDIGEEIDLLDETAEKKAVNARLQPKMQKMMKGEAKAFKNHQAMEKVEEAARERATNRVRARLGLKPKMDADEAQRKGIIPPGEEEINLDDEVQEKLDTQTRIRESMGKIRTKQMAKLEEMQRAKEANEQMLRPPEAILEQGTQFEQSTKELAERRRGVSLEEAKMLVPQGDRIAEFIEEQAQKSHIGGFALTMDRSKDWMSYANNIDLGLHYVRVLGHYRSAVEKKNESLRKEVLHRLTGLNRALGIPMNALVEQALEPEDLGYAREQLAIDAKAYAANEIENASKEVAEIPMTVDRVKKFNLVTRPGDLWDSVAAMLPKNKQKLATEYVLALARVNEASRKVDHVGYDKAKDAFDKMSTALQIESRADVLSSTEDRPGEHYENPFSS